MEFLLLIALFLYLIALVKDKKKCINAIKISLTYITKGLPVLLIALLIASLVKIALGNYQIELSKNWIISILIATFLGFLLPGPRYIIYPIAKAFVESGIGYSTILVLIYSQQLITFPEGAIVEIKFFGKRFFIVRLLTSIVLCILSGVLWHFVFGD